MEQGCCLQPRAVEERRLTLIFRLGEVYGNYDTHLTNFGPRLAISDAERPSVKIGKVLNKPTIVMQ